MFPRKRFVRYVYEGDWQIYRENVEIVMIRLRRCVFVCFLTKQDSDRFLSIGRNILDSHLLFPGPSFLNLGRDVLRIRGRVVLVRDFICYELSDPSCLWTELTNGRVGYETQGLSPSCRAECRARIISIQSKYNLPDKVQSSKISYPS